MSSFFRVPRRLEIHEICLLRDSCPQPDLCGNISCKHTKSVMKCVDKFLYFLSEENKLVP